jgi:hypothetical protein
MLSAGKAEDGLVIQRADDKQYFKVSIAETEALARIARLVQEGIDDSQTGEVKFRHYHSKEDPELVEQFRQLHPELAQAADHMHDTDDEERDQLHDDTAQRDGVASSKYDKQDRRKHMPASEYEQVSLLSDSARQQPRRPKHDPPSSSSLSSGASGASTSERAPLLPRDQNVTNVEDVGCMDGCCNCTIL